MKKYLNFLFLGIIVLHLLLIAYQKQNSLTTPFDKGYWKERYEQSQWRLPLSERTIGDDGLFLYQGYLLAQGADPSIYNPEVPPVGKYIIGFFIILFNNGALSGFITTSTVLLVYYLLAKQLYRNTTLSLFLVTLLATDPLITEQFFISMLDSIQLLYLLISFLFLYNLGHFSKHVNIWAIVSGGLLGLTAGIKAPIILIPLVIYLVSYFILKRKLFVLLLFISSFITCYMFPYVLYFLHNHTLKEWLGLQKFMTLTYRQSKLAPHYGSLFYTLFLNSSHNLFTRVWETGHVYSPMWPLFTVGGVFGSIAFLKKHTLLTMGIATTTMFSLFLFSIIPFWTRYLVIIIPFLLLASGSIFVRYYTSKTASVTLIMLVLIQWTTTLPTLFPTPESSTTLFLHSWNHGFFHDMYQQIKTNNKTTEKRLAFHERGQRFYNDAEIEHVTATISSTFTWSRLASPQYVPIHVTYTTRYLNQFTHTSTIPVINNHGQWEFDWQWKYLFPELSADSLVKTAHEFAKRGSIYTSTGELAAWDHESMLVSILPSAVNKQRESDMLTDLAVAFDDELKSVHIHHRYIFNRLSNNIIPIGVLPTPPDNVTMQRFLTYPGVILTPHLTRLNNTRIEPTIGTVANTQYPECCARLYSVSTYYGHTGIEKTYDHILTGQNGGTLEIQYPEGTKHVLIKQEKKDGTDVYLSSK